MIPLGIAHLTALDQPPGRFIQAAAKASFNSVGLRFWPTTSAARQVLAGR